MRRRSGCMGIWDLGQNLEEPLPLPLSYEATVYTQVFLAP